LCSTYVFFCKLDNIISDNDFPGQGAGPGFSLCEVPEGWSWWGRRIGSETSLETFVRNELGPFWESSSGGVRAQILDTVVRMVLWRGVLEGARAQILDAVVRHVLWRVGSEGVEGSESRHCRQNRALEEGFWRGRGLRLSMLSCDT